MEHTWDDDDDDDSWGNVSLLIQDVEFTSSYFTDF